MNTCSLIHKKLFKIILFSAASNLNFNEFTSIDIYNFSSEAKESVKIHFLFPTASSIQREITLRFEYKYIYTMEPRYNILQYNVIMVVT